MSLLLGDTGKVQIGSLKSFNITPGTARETLLGTPLILPTAEPATSQVVFTVQSSDLPVISPSVPMKYNASIICSGKIGATSSVINYRVLKNSVSIAQAAGSSATATQFWTHSHWRTFDVQIGDVLEVRYWSSQTDTNLDFYGLIIYPSQANINKTGVILKDLGLLSTNSFPNFTTALVVSATGGFYLYPYNNTTSLYFTGDITFNAILPNTTLPLWKAQYGDVTSLTNQLVHATQRQYQKQLYPTSISFREVIR